MAVGPASQESPSRWATPSAVQRYPNLVWICLLLPLTAYLIYFFFQPIVVFFAQSFGGRRFSLAAYVQVFSTPAYLLIIWNTVRLSLIVTIACAVIGYPVAFCLTRVRGPWQVLLWASILMPFWTSVLVRSYAWIVILGANGVIDSLLRTIDAPWHPQLLYNDISVVVGMVHVLLPYMILTLYGVMRGIDFGLVRAAASLGAPPWTAFFRIYFPMSMPGVASGFLVVFILAMGFYITPALLGGGKVPVIALQIETQVDELVNWQFAAALSVVLVAVIMVVVALANRLFDVKAFGMPERTPPKLGAAAPATGNAELLPPPAFSGRFTADAGPLTSRSYKRPPLDLWLHATGTLTVAVCLFLVAPVLVVAAMSFGSSSYLAFPPHGFSLRWYAAFFSGPQWIASSWASFQVAALSALLAVALGSLAALAFVRGRFPGKTMLYFAAILPLIVPVIVTAVSIYFLFSQLHLVGNVWGFIAADTILAVPTVILITSAALRGADTRLEQAAMILGAHPVRAFVAVTLPGIVPSLAAAGLFAFISSFDESVIALFLSTAKFATLPKTMWDSLRFQIDPTISAISTLLVALTIVVLLLGSLLLFYGGRRSDALNQTIDVE